jgi:hypothetical protein
MTVRVTLVQMRKVQVAVLVRKEDVQVPEGARAVTGDLLDPVSVCMS